VTDLIIYGVKGSPFVRKVQVLLAEKGLEYEIEAVMPFPPPDWFVELNPAKRIPVLRDRSVGKDGVAGTIPDSSPICAYIERKHPEPALYPDDPFEYGRALWVEEYADSELAARIGIGMFRPMIFPPMSGKERDVDRARKTLAEDMPPFFDYFEGLLEGGREFVVGDRFGIADIALATQFVNLHHAGGRVDPARWPGLADFVARMHARPSFAACIGDEQKLFPPHGIEL